MVAKGRPPASAEEALRWREQDHVAIGVCGDTGVRWPGRWPGHLVAIAGEQYLIDLSLPQMNRPEKQVELTPILCRVTPSFLAGEGVIAFALNGCRLLYQALPGDHSYAGATDWHDAARHQQAIQAIGDLLHAASRPPGTPPRRWHSVSDEAPGQAC
jgi:hypothetical protein